MVGSKLAGVFLVMSFGISSSVYPTARRAAIFAIGKPVAFEARAEERETRGFISITAISPLAGPTANGALEPAVPPPTARVTRIAWSRSPWERPSVRVFAGAAVTELAALTP